MFFHLIFRIPHFGLSSILIVYFSIVTGSSSFLWTLNIGMPQTGFLVLKISWSSVMLSAICMLTNPNFILYFRLLSQTPNYTYPTIYLQSSLELPKDSSNITCPKLDFGCYLQTSCLEIPLTLIDNNSVLLVAKPKTLALSWFPHCSSRSVQRSFTYILYLIIS